MSWVGTNPELKGLLLCSQSMVDGECLQSSVEKDSNMESVRSVVKVELTGTHKTMKRPLRCEGAENNCFLLTFYFDPLVCFGRALQLWKFQWVYGSYWARVGGFRGMDWCSAVCTKLLIARNGSVLSQNQFSCWDLPPQAPTSSSVEALWGWQVTPWELCPWVVKH